MWLLKKLALDFKTIADFRKDNKQAIKRVCREFILLCKKLDLFSGELVAIDGSKFKAVNSKKRNFNQQKLKKKIKEIGEKIEDYFKDLEENDVPVCRHAGKFVNKEFSKLFGFWVRVCVNKICNFSLFVIIFNYGGTC